MSFWPDMCASFYFWTNIPSSILFTLCWLSFIYVYNFKNRLQLIVFYFWTDIFSSILFTLCWLSLFIYCNSIVPNVQDKCKQTSMSQIAINNILLQENKWSTRKFASDRNFCCKCWYATVLKLSITVVIYLFLDQSATISFFLMF